MMRSTHLRTVVVVASVWACSTACAQLLDPNAQAFSFQASLTGMVDGPHDLHITLYDAEVGGSQQGPTIDVTADIVNGIVSEQISVPDITVFDGGLRLWAEVAVDADPPLTPRVPLIAVPYAFRVHQVSSKELDDAITLGNDEHSGELRVRTQYGGYESLLAGGLLHLYADSNLLVELDATAYPQGYMNVKYAGARRVGLWALEEGGRIYVYDNGASERGIELRGQFDQSNTGGWMSINDGGIERITLAGAGGGTVGIGTADPGSPLTVFRDDGMSDGQFLTSLTNSDQQGAQGSVLLLQGGALSPNSKILELRDFDSNPVLIADGLGRVGIGTASPKGTLSVDQCDVEIEREQDIYADTKARLTISSANQGPPGLRVTMSDDDGATFTDALFIAETTEVGIGTTVPQAQLHVVGRTRTDVLEIAGADVAERFPVSERVKPGMVVAIDPKHPGKLCLSRGAYDTRVAGVVSGANNLPAGAVLGHLPGSEDAPPIALSGRVWAYCDATEQPIEPGDLLTTSDTPGHAMKVTDHAKAQGAIIGKAMTPLDAGRELVLVLVSLQ